ncbi:MAG: sensor histidine kinase, partial [Symploca sp. SIO1A3]|nr:sensor histidine kinase [Symploca sp. SIO1A3]
MIENQLAQATEDLRTRLRTVYQWLNELPHTQEQAEWLAQTFAELHTSLEVLEIAQEQLEYKFWQQTAELQRVSKQLQTEVRKSKPVAETPQEYDEGDCTNFEQATPGIEDISKTDRQTTQSQQTPEQLRTSLQEQEILVEEIHHRVKNNLQIVSSLLYLQANRSNDPQVHAILQESRNRVESMALVHESLSRSGELTKINFTEYVHNLATNLFSIYNVQPSNIALRISAPTDIFINLDKAIPCGLIINELITNALKHSFMTCNQ